MKRFILLFICLSNLSWGSEIKDKLLAILPAPISQLKISKTTLPEAEKVLGKADLKEGEKYYWIQEDYKYALELQFKNNTLSSLHYTYPGERPAVEKVGKFETKKLLPYPAGGKSKGRFLLLKEKDAEFVIDPITQTIYSVKIL